MAYKDALSLTARCLRADARATISSIALEGCALCFWGCLGFRVLGSGFKFASKHSPALDLSSEFENLTQKVLCRHSIEALIIRGLGPLCSININRSPQNSTDNYLGPYITWRVGGLSNWLF